MNVTKPGPENLPTDAPDNRPPDEGAAADNLGASGPLPTSHKRKAESEDGDAGAADGVDPTGQDGASTGADGAPLSKNQLKKLKRQKLYEDRKEDRKMKRKEQRHNRQARKRAEREALIASGVDLASLKPPPEKHELIPVAFIIDCDFEQYMNEGELTSVANQVERCYSENRKARYRAHLVVNSWKGKIKDRYEKVLHNNHLRWKGIHLVEGDFLEGAKVAQEAMKGARVGTTIDPIGAGEPHEAPALNCTALGVAPAAKAKDGLDTSIVYLTADSPNSLDRLEANTCYVIGGLVDKNRIKGLSYKRGSNARVRTARLPIGEFMAMQSRFVLTINQVVEVMLKWLECGDWGKAFLEVIPKRKGGSLLHHASPAENGDEPNEDEPGGDEPNGDEPIGEEPKL